MIPSEWIDQFLGKSGLNMDLNMIANGYKSTNFFQNLGGFVVVIGLFVLFVIFLVIIGVAINKLKNNLKVRKLYKKVYVKVFWGSVLQVCIHSYTKICISNFIDLKNSKWTSPAGLLTFLFYLNGFPLFVMYFVWEYRKQLQ